MFSVKYELNVYNSDTSASCCTDTVVQTREVSPFILGAPVSDFHWFIHCTQHRRDMHMHCLHCCQSMHYMQGFVFLTDLQIAVLPSEGQQPVSIDLHSVIQHVVVQVIAGQEAGHSVRWSCCCSACLNNSISGYACYKYCFQQHLKLSGYQE